MEKLETKSELNQPGGKRGSSQLSVLGCGKGHFNMGHKKAWWKRMTIFVKTLTFSYEQSFARHILSEEYNLLTKMFAALAYKVNVKSEFGFCSQV